MRRQIDRERRVKRRWRTEGSKIKRVGTRKQEGRMGKEKRKDRWSERRVKSRGRKGDKKTKR